MPPPNAPVTSSPSPSSDSVVGSGTVEDRVARELLSFHWCRDQPSSEVARLLHRKATPSNPAVLMPIFKFEMMSLLVEVDLRQSKVEVKQKSESALTVQIHTATEVLETRGAADRHCVRDSRRQER